jgi:hypothetical protein
MTCGPNCQVYLYHFILFVWRQRATSSPGPSHIITLTLPTSTLPPSGISDGEHPPWLSQSLMAMSRRQAFVVLTPRLVEGLPYYHDAVSPSSSLTRWIAPAMWCLAGSPSRLLALFLPPPPRSRLHMARCTRYLTKTYVMSRSLWMAFFLCGTLMALSPLPLPPRPLLHGGVLRISEPVWPTLHHLGACQCLAEPSSNDVLCCHLGHPEQHCNTSIWLWERLDPHPDAGVWLDPIVTPSMANNATNVRKFFPNISPAPENHGQMYVLKQLLKMH